MRIIEVITQGPQGPQGPTGPSGLVNTSSLATTGSNTFNGNQTITGSITSTLGFTGSLQGTSSWAVNSITASSADNFNIRTSLTSSGLRYPTVDGFANQVIETDGSGNLSFDDVHTMLEDVRSGESITKGDPLYISGSQGAKPIVYKADAANSAKMPVTYIALETVGANTDTRGIILGLIEGINLTGYNAGTEVYVAAGGGWSSTRPTGSATVQILGYVTKGGNGGKGLVLNPGPANLPNLPSGSIWVGNSGSVPVAVLTSSLSVATASYINTLNQSVIITGSTQGNVTTLTIASNTASLNLNSGNFFTLQLVQGTNTYINPSNIKPGQSSILLLSTTGSATVSFPSTVKQPSGSSYTPTTTTGTDILTFASLDNTNLYLVNVKNLI